MSVGERLRKFRDERGWSQETVAKMLKISRSTVSRYETGIVEPDDETLIQFAELYKVDLPLLQNKRPEPQTGFRIEENLNADPDLAIINKLFQEEPDLKKALVEMYLIAPKQRSYIANVLVAAIKTGKK